jgi:hypothetical protein
MDTFVIPRLLAAALALGVWTVAAQAQTLDEQLRTLLAGGTTPANAASRLVAAGAYPEDVAALLFRAVPGAIRAVAFAVVRDSARFPGTALVPLAAELAGLAQPEAVPAAAIALAAPDQITEAAGVLAQAVPQAAPLIIAAVAKIAPMFTAACAGAAARAVPQQGIFIAAAAAVTHPETREATFTAVGLAIGMPGDRVAVLAEASEAVGANAFREADEALAGLPLGSPVRYTAWKSG